MKQPVQYMKNQENMLPNLLNGDHLGQQ